MTAHEWVKGRQKKGLTQVEAAKFLGVSQPYLSQLETGMREAGSTLSQEAARFYELTTALPLATPKRGAFMSSHSVQKDLAALGYPKFAHVSVTTLRNPAAVVLEAVVQRDLDTRLVEALPWVLTSYVDLNWGWLRDQAKLRNAQNRLGYVVYLAKEVAKSRGNATEEVQVLSSWEQELESARLAHEDTLCRESMPERERAWLRANRPTAAAHWNLLTSLSPGQLPYA